MVKKRPFLGPTQLFTKSKSLVLQCRQCEIEQKDEQNVLSILKKLGSEYYVFFSIFHSKQEIFNDWKIPSLDSFSESLIKKKDKFIGMGVIKTSKDQALLVSDSSKAQAKGKSKKKEPKAADLNPKHNQQTLEGASDSKQKKKFEKNSMSLL